VTEAGAPGHSAGYYIAIFRRRAWIIVLCTLIGLNVAWLYSARQPATYRASSEIVITTQTYTDATGMARDQERQAETLARLADNPGVAAQAIELAGVSGWTADELLKHSKVTADPTANLVSFAVTGRDPGQVTALANGYADSFAQRTQDEAAAQIHALLDPLQARIKYLNTRIANLQQTINTKLTNGQSPATEQQLVRNLSTQLEVALTSAANYQTQLATLPGTAQVASVATEAAQVGPATERNIAAGLFLGLMIGLGLAFLRESLDTRLRTSDDLVEELGINLLARIPAPPKELRKLDRLALLADDPGVDAEAYRKLRVGLDFANLKPRAQVIMMTSAVEQEGKSTTVANLAVAMAQIGRNVILVDLDLRRPYLARFFDLGQIPGVTDVALGHLTLDHALHAITVSGTRPGTPVTGAASAKSLEGTLQVLTSGENPSDPVAFLESEALEYLIEELKERADVVLIDAPPVLPVSDAMAISRKVDAMIVVSRLEVVRRPVARELRRELDGATVPILGLVLTGADADASYGYGYGYGYGYNSPSQAPVSSRDER
jgi:Mrp family chromosome partitioning ATPase/capsular polysaccharide biosynthesis protein